MKKNKLFIAGLAVMMAAALILSGCGEDKTNTDPKKIVITGLPNDITGDINIVLAGSMTEDGMVAMGQGTVSSGRAEAELYDYATMSGGSPVKWTGTGSYYVGISAGSNMYASKTKIGINDTTTTIAFDSFEPYTGSGE
jgi:hypothetical protein